jgi:hypothetical protein
LKKNAKKVPKNRDVASYQYLQKRS